MIEKGLLCKTNVLHLNSVLTWNKHKKNSAGVFGFHAILGAVPENKIPPPSHFDKKSDENLANNLLWPKGNYLRQKMSMQS